MLDRILVTYSSSYQHFATNPQWIQPADGDARLCWGISPRPIAVKAQPCDVLLGLVQAEPFNPEAALELARTFGPFLNHANVFGDDGTIGEMWDQFTGVTTVHRDARSARGAVIDFLTRDEDGVPFATIAGERDRLLKLGRRLGVLPGAMPLPKWFVSPSLESAVADDEARGQFVLRWERQARLSGPVYAVAPQGGYGIFANAELGIIQLVGERLDIKQCQRPACGLLFHPTDRRLRRYCSPRCKRLADAEAKDRARAAQRS